MPDTQISEEMVEKALDAWLSSPPEDTLLSMRAALEAALSGHAVVPREPTQAMIEAGWDAANRDIGGDVIGTIEIQSVIGRSVYRAMIQAAPPEMEGRP